VVHSDQSGAFRPPAQVAIIAGIATESKTSGNKKVTFIPNVKGGTWMMK